jgi:1,6-anhydro-N-acetylmuramate kinase
VKVVGIISGTSFDAIETAVADLRLEDDAVVLRLLGSRSVPYDPGLRAAVADALPPAATSAGEVCMLDTRLGRAFAEAAAGAAQEFCGGLADLIVCHGQTIFHWVEREKALGTLQLGQPAWIAGRTGSPVVSDLRSRDVAEGGGTSNPTLMGMLQEYAPQVRLRKIEDWGIPSGAKEAYAFALMGFLSVHGLPSNVPSCTGARSAVVLGSITPGRKPLVLPDPTTRAPGRLRIEAVVCKEV